MELTKEQLIRIDALAYVLKCTTSKHANAMTKNIIGKYVISKAKENYTTIDEEIKKLEDEKNYYCVKGTNIYYSTELAEKIWNYKNLCFKGASKIEDWGIGLRLFNCLKRGKIDCLSDVLAKGEMRIAQTRNTGEKTIQELKRFLANIGVEMFTNEELGVLQGSMVEFNFYGEDRTVKDFQRMGLSKELIDKMFKNGLIERNFYKENIVAQKQPTILDRVPKDLHKYVVLGVGEDVKNKIIHALIISDSDRLIKNRINNNQLEHNMPRVNIKPRRIVKNGLKDNNILAELKKNKNMLFDLDEEFIYNHQNIIWKIIAGSGLELSTKRDLIRYVEGVCDKVRNDTIIKLH